MSADSIRELQVVGVRYRGSKLVEGDERCLDAYTAAGVYAALGVPYSVREPAFPEQQRGNDEPGNIGLMAGTIAEAVAEAGRAGRTVLMTGGDCTHCTGMLGGLQDIYGPTTPIGLVWFDAHGDFNTPRTTLSGMLGGMPVAVAAGLAYPHWRESAHIAAPLSTDRILMVDVRNLDPPEAQLIGATDIQIAAPAPGFPGTDLTQAVAELAARCEALYLHIDSDILDATLVPNHGTREPNGPSMEQVLAAIDTVMATGKVIALAVVSVYGAGEGRDVSIASGIELIRGSLQSWGRYGVPRLAV